jgi:hypothetical protein
VRPPYACSALTTISNELAFTDLGQMFRVAALLHRDGASAGDGECRVEHETCPSGLRGAVRCAKGNVKETARAVLSKSSSCLVRGSTRDIRMATKLPAQFDPHLFLRRAGEIERLLEGMRMAGLPER